MENVKCPNCNSQDLTYTSEPSYICNSCGYPNKIKYTNYATSEMYSYS